MKLADLATGSDGNHSSAVLSHKMMMPGSKGQKVVHACMTRLLNLGPAKHRADLRCFRIAGA